MGTSRTPPAGPDLTAGIAATALAEGQTILGHVGEDAVLLLRAGSEVRAVGATCTHYGAPLADGLVVGDTIRCPWHHACFSLRSGAALRPPALFPVACWRVEEENGRLIVRERLEPEAPRALKGPDLPASVVIVGGGAAGHAAAQTLRLEGYDGPVTLLSADTDPPCDRPNLSKDFLAGTAQPEWIPLQPPEFYRERHIDLQLGAEVVAIEPASRQLRLADGRQLSYGALLLATGAEPIRLQVPGAELPVVHVLRRLADSRALIAAAGSARRCVVVGASFIGLEVTAALRARGLDADVVAPEARPMERVMGREIGDMVRTIHESHGVRFHLGATVSGIDKTSVTLSTGAHLPADLVVVGIGVRPATGLAEQAGLAVDRGVLADEFLQTSVPGIFAAGDIVRWPDPHTGTRIRVEHWVVAQRQGQVAARNMLGRRERFDAVPFFWSQHYDIVIGYVGHAERWDRIEIEGDPARHDATATFWEKGRKRAVVTVGRDRDSLKAELELEKEAAQ